MSVLRIMLAAATLLLFCLPEILHGRARVKGNQQQLLLDLENRWLESEDNPDELESILADDFIHVLPLGFVTKSEQLRYMRTHPASQRRTTKRFDDLRVRIFGDTGIVNGIVVVYIYYAQPTGVERASLSPSVTAARRPIRSDQSS